MDRHRPSNSFKKLYATCLVAILLTAVGLSYRLRNEPRVQNKDLPSQSAPSAINCEEPSSQALSLSQYFEADQAIHFYSVIANTLESKPNSKRKLQAVSDLLAQLNDELISPRRKGQSLQLQRWIQLYPGSERFKVRDHYDLQSFFVYLEQDVHRFFHKLMTQALLPENYWHTRSVLNPEVIESLGVRLSENTWARVGSFPSKWHLHVYKSSALQTDPVRPKEHFPLQSLSLRIWDFNRMEVLDGSGRIQLKADSVEQLDLIPYCEWVSGTTRLKHQLSQKSLRSL